MSPGPAQSGANLGRAVADFMRTFARASGRAKAVTLAVIAGFAILCCVGVAVLAPGSSSTPVPSTGGSSR